ncbi:hypothetical protein ACLN6N_08970 [Sphingomonas carotinifaciens]|uniref:hypothetical protein n=1 Tax=Sphingomonas carotinifaciens TaxID=1166323 RepID=UPI0012373409|nr:hypothetical protein [Sphingomonas carotinifaciens]
MHRIAAATLVAIALPAAATAQISGAPVESKPGEATAPGEEQPSARGGDDRPSSRDARQADPPATTAPDPRPSIPPSPDGTTEPSDGAPTSTSDAPAKN